MRLSSQSLYHSIMFVFLLVGAGWKVAFAQQEATKQVCLTPFGMNWQTSEEARAHLVMAAKREAASEIFGEMIRGITQVRNFQLQRDDIESISWTLSQTSLPKSMA